MIKHKTLLLLFLIVTVLLTMTACTKSKPTNVTNNDSVYVLKVGIDKSSSHAFAKGLEVMNEELKELTNNKVELKIYTDSVLGSEREMTESLILGNLDMTVNGMLGSYEPLFNVLDAPYLFINRDQIRAFHESDSFSMLTKSLEENSNIKVLNYFEGGFRQVTNNTKPIYTPDDIKGMKMRVPEMEAMKLTFAALDTVVTPMNSKELYSALQQGTVDGQENPYANIYNNHFQDVQNYVSATNHQYNSGYIYMSKSKFDSLPKEYQTALMDASLKASKWNVDYAEKNDDLFKQKLIDEGMEFNEVDLDAFQIATEGVYETFYKNYGDEAKKLVNQIKSFAK